MNKKAFTLVEMALVILAVCVIPALIVGFTLWTDRSLEWVLSEWKHHAVQVPIWISFLITLVGNGFVFAFNIIVELMRCVR